MKKNIYWVLGLAVSISGFLVINSLNNDAYAVSGCCKVRKSESSPWRRQGNDLPACKQINKDSDNDNAFRKTGLVWWDMNC